MNEVVVKKILNAPPEKAYKAFSDESTWSTWFSENTRIDLRKGGRFSNSDGDCGEYLEIQPNRLLQFTWEKGHPGEVEISFRPVTPTQTEVMLRHSKLASSESATHMTPCWTWTLDNLDTFLQTGKPLPYSQWKAQQN